MNKGFKSMRNEAVDRVYPDEKVSAGKEELKNITKAMVVASILLIAFILIATNNFIPTLFSAIAYAFSLGFTMIPGPMVEETAIDLMNSPLISAGFFRCTSSMRSRAFSAIFSLSMDTLPMGR